MPENLNLRLKPSIFQRDLKSLLLKYLTTNVVYFIRGFLLKKGALEVYKYA